MTDRLYRCDFCEGWKYDRDASHGCLPERVAKLEARVAALEEKP